jgi:methylated-DNA-[protein]-cysteine S-methyltransferase
MTHEARFNLERVNTPIGQMLIVTDSEQQLRALDWEDHERRMQKLFVRHYGSDALRLHELSEPSGARRALQAYFEGELDALTRWPTATNGTEFQRRVWGALRLIPSGQTISYGQLAARVGCNLRRAALLGLQTAPIRLPSPFLAIASSAQTTH